MTAVWLMRLRSIAAVLLVVSLASLALAGILAAAGDSVGAEVLCGAAMMTGLCFVIDVSLIALDSSVRGLHHAASTEPLAVDH